MVDPRLILPAGNEPTPPKPTATVIMVLYMTPLTKREEWREWEVDSWGWFGTVKGWLPIVLDDEGYRVLNPGTYRIIR